MGVLLAAGGLARHDGRHIQLHVQLVRLMHGVVQGADITGTDWTDVVMGKFMQKQLCSIASGTNPATGVDTRESLLCP